MIDATQIADGSWDTRFFELNIGTAARAGFGPDHYVGISDVFGRKIEALKKLEADAARRLDRIRLYEIPTA